MQADTPRTDHCDPWTPEAEQRLMSLAKVVSIESGRAIGAALAELSRRGERIKALEGALERVNAMLTISAAEYVPAIPDCWKVIEDAMKGRMMPSGNIVPGGPTNPAWREHQEAMAEAQGHATLSPPPTPEPAGRLPSGSAVEGRRVLGLDAPTPCGLCDSAGRCTHACEQWPEIDAELRGAPTPSDEVVGLVEHTAAVSDFLNELYAIMVDPCVEGTITVAEIKKALIDAALSQREVLASALERLSAGRPSEEEVARVIEPDAFESHYDAFDRFYRSRRDGALAKARAILALWGSDNA